MALYAFMTITGEANIQGSAQQKGREGKIVVFGVRHDIVSPTDKDGMPVASDTKFGPLVVSKNFDSASPALHAAHIAGKLLSKVSVEFWRMPPRGGQEENYMTITLTGAKVLSYRTVMDDARKQENQLIPEYEEVGFAYEQVHWKYSADKEKPGDSSNVAVKYRREEYFEERLGRTLTDFLKELPKSVSDGVKDAIKTQTKEAVSPEKEK
jgi:type VI secretion system secreted protein Hcp